MPVTGGGGMGQPVQLIAPDGTATAEDRYRRDLPPELLTWLYETMVVTRDLDGEWVNLQRQGELALYAACRGQEAAQVGATACLRKTDWLFPQYRELGAFLVRGITPPDGRHVARHLARRAGVHREMLRPDRHPHRHPHPARRRRRDGRPAARRGLGDRGVPRRRRHQRGRHPRGDEPRRGHQGALRVLRAEQPVGHLGAGAPPARRGSIAARRPGYGMAGIIVDGNDVLACYAVMAEAAARARDGEGPTLIEAITYRMGPHTTSDDPSRYRSAEEVEEWAAQDPISRYRTYLERAGVWTERVEQRAAARSARLRAEARTAVIDGPDPEPGSCSTTCTRRSRRRWRRRSASCSPSWRRRPEMTQIIERPAMSGGDDPEPIRPLLTDLPAVTSLTMAAAINRAMHDAMAADERVLIFGEDVATLGGCSG